MTTALVFLLPYSENKWCWILLSKGGLTRQTTIGLNHSESPFPYFYGILFPKYCLPNYLSLSPVSFFIVSLVNWETENNQ